MHEQEQTNDAAAIIATFVNIKTMADGTPRLVLDLQCSLSEVAAMGLIPGVPFALARMTKEAAGNPVVSQPEAPKEKPGPLCILACNLCSDKAFQKWIAKHYHWDCSSEEETRDFILRYCGIESRKDLDTNGAAAAYFHSHFRIPFIAWRDAQ